MITGNYQVILECGDYKFKQIDNFGLSLNEKSENKNSQHCRENTYDLKIKTDRRCDFGLKMVHTAHKYCFGKIGICSFTYNMSELNTACSRLSKHLNFFYMAYRCERNNFLI